MIFMRLWTQNQLCFVFLKSYTLPKIDRKQEKNSYIKILMFNGIIYFLFKCVSFSSFFNTENFFKEFVVPAVTVRKVYDREVISFYGVSSLTA